MSTYNTLLTILMLVNEECMQFGGLWV